MMVKRLTVTILLVFFSAASLFAGETQDPLRILANVPRSTDSFFDQLATPIQLYQDLVKIKFSGEFRYRLERRDDFNFNRNTFEDDVLNLFRPRLGFDLTVGPHLRVFVQGQDSESVASSGLDRTSAFVNRLDLHQLYAEVKSPWEAIPLSVTVGRQELAYGDERFVGAFNWSNVARVFDAVKIVFQPMDWFRLDMWFSQVVPVNRSQADSANHDDNFYGIYNSLKPIKDHVFDTFLFIRHNRNRSLAGERPGERGPLKEFTVGNRFKGKKWNFDYGIEWALQGGSRAHDAIKAWAWHNEVGYTIPKIPWSPRPNVEFNHGSGDHDPTDGDFENFDNLYPTNHSYYGYMDFFSLRNMDSVKTGLDLKPTSKLKFSCDYHWFFLDTNRSAWFNASQNIVRSASSNASTTAGQEMDLLLNWQISNHLNFLVGFSHFHAGAFARDTGTHDSANFFYIQPSIKF